RGRRTGETSYHWTNGVRATFTTSGGDRFGRGRPHLPAWHRLGDLRPRRIPEEAAKRSARPPRRHRHRRRERRPFGRFRREAVAHLVDARTRRRAVPHADAAGPLRRAVAWWHESR